MRAAVVIATAILCCPAIAAAGRSHFGWIYGSEINPNNGVELENWIIDTNQKGAADGGTVDETETWTGIVFALSEHVQLAVALETNYTDDHMTTPATNVDKFGADVRWRPQAADAKGLTTLFRFGLKRLVADRAGVRTEADIVTSFEAGRFVASLDVGAIEEHLPGDNVFEAHPGIGASVRVVGGFRVGAEVYGEFTVIGPDPSWAVAGPTVSLTSGRLWGAATFGAGVLGIKDGGRITLGVVL
jgi:hypothetical protein